MPDQACHGPDTDKEQHRSRGEQEAHEPHQQAHYLFIRSNSGSAQRSAQDSPWHPKLAPIRVVNSPALLNTISAGPKTLAERDSRRFRNPLRRFYKAPAVAKLGLLRRDGKSLLNSTILRSSI